MAGIVFAAVAPHGTFAVEEACTPEELALGVATRAAFSELGRRLRAAEVDAVVVASPHTIHVEGAMAVVESARAEGAVSGSDGRMVALACEIDRSLSAGVLDALRTEGVPAVGVSFGGNRLDEAVMPLDWGALIPLWHLGARFDPPLHAAIVSPARDLSPEAHVDAGRAIASAAAGSGRRVAFVASADHGHAHDPDGPYGFHPAAAAYDRAVVEAFEQGLGGLTSLEASLVEDAAADSWWQLLMLHGVLGSRFEGEVLSYEVPTYYGMACAAFTPRA